MSPPQGHRIIAKYFSDLSKDQLDKLQSLSGLYRHWNERINVISRKDIDELYIRHVLHSLAIAKYIRFLPESKVLDLGTGGGFPGIPLAIYFPKVHFLLADSIGKKIRVVEEVSKSLGLDNVAARASRVEQMDGKFDFIVTRAVARLARLKTWGNGKLSKTSRHELANGIIALKGGDLSEELKEAKSTRVEQIHLRDYFEEPFFETKKIIYFGF